MVNSLSSESAIEAHAYYKIFRLRHGKEGEVNRAKNWERVIAQHGEEFPAEGPNKEFDHGKWGNFIGQHDLQLASTGYILNAANQSKLAGEILEEASTGWRFFDWLFGVEKKVNSAVSKVFTEINAFCRRKEAPQQDGSYVLTKDLQARARSQIQEGITAPAFTKGFLRRPLHLHYKHILADTKVQKAPEYDVNRCCRISAEKHNIRNKVDDLGRKKAANGKEKRRIQRSESPIEEQVARTNLYYKINTILRRDFTHISPDKILNKVENALTKAMPSSTILDISGAILTYATRHAPSLLLGNNLMKESIFPLIKEAVNYEKTLKVPRVSTPIPSGRVAPSSASSDRAGSAPPPLSWLGDSDSEDDDAGEIASRLIWERTRPDQVIKPEAHRVDLVKSEEEKANL